MKQFIWNVILFGILWMACPKVMCFKNLGSLLLTALICTVIATLIGIVCLAIGTAIQFANNATMVIAMFAVFLTILMFANAMTLYITQKIYDSVYIGVGFWGYCIIGFVMGFGASKKRK